jgi:thiamine biosynthesis lipoprotein
MTAAPTPLRFDALGTQVLIVSPAADRLAQALCRLVAGYEASFSRFLPDSELERLCETTGEEVPVSPEMFEVLSLAARYWRETDGIFDPLIRPELEAAGYDRTFAAVARWSPGHPQSPKAERASFGDACLDAERRSVLLPEGAKLDLGGIAKGWIVDRLGEMLAPQGPFLVDIGGDMVAQGAGPDGGSGWLIAVADPYRPEHDVCWLRLQDQAIATSTTARRRWMRGNRWLHHLIDPRSGAPAESDVVQATVLAPTAVEADVCAKTALILGRDAGLGWLDQRGWAAMLITTNGTVAGSRWPRDEAPLATYVR